MFYLLNMLIFRVFVTFYSNFTQDRNLTRFYLVLSCEYVDFPCVSVCLVLFLFFLPPDNRETARLVQGAGGQCRAYTVDLSDRQNVYAAANKVKQEVGKVSMDSNALTDNNDGLLS